MKMFEEVTTPKRGDKVLCWNDFEDCAETRIFIAEIEGPMYPYHVVSQFYEQEYKDDLTFITVKFKHCKSISQFDKNLLALQDALSTAQDALSKYKVELR